MRVVFRTDASSKIGTGHVMRCLTLAESLRSSGAEILFICRKHSGHIAGIIKARGFNCELLPESEQGDFSDVESPAHANWLGVDWRQDAEETISLLKSNYPDWIVVDHYGIDQRWHQCVRPSVGRIMVIDDLADRQLDCDVLLDQNFYLNSDQRYRGLVTSECISLLGPCYALLRKEFIKIEKIRSCEERKEVKRILVFMGGSDPTNETVKVLMALDQLVEHKFEVDVVVSSANPNAKLIQEICQSKNMFNFYQDVTNISALMNNADLALGAGGATTLERCYLGLPSLTITVAKNQLETTQALSNVGAIVYLGWCADVGVNDIAEQIKDCMNHANKIKELCRSSMNIMGQDKYLGADGVVSVMMELA